MKSLTGYLRKLKDIKVTRLIDDKASLGFRREQRWCCLGFSVSPKFPPGQIILTLEAGTIPHPLSFCCLLSRLNSLPLPQSTQQECLDVEQTAYKS